MEMIGNLIGAGIMTASFIIGKRYGYMEKQKEIDHLKNKIAAMQQEREQEQSSKYRQPGGKFLTHKIMKDMDE